MSVLDPNIGGPEPADTAGPGCPPLSSPAPPPAEDSSHWPDRLFTIEDGGELVITIEPRTVA